MPSARLNTLDGKTTEWRSQALRAYQRRTLPADALIAGCYFPAPTCMRRVRRALRALFGGAAGKDTVPGSVVCAPTRSRDPAGIPGRGRRDPTNPHARNTGRNLFRQFQPFAAQAVFELHKASRVTAWPRQCRVVGLATFRLRDDCLASRAAILMRLLASTAAPTNNSKRLVPSARQRFMPRPRNSTEMRPSMPARKRWPCLKAGAVLVCFALRGSLAAALRDAHHLDAVVLAHAKFCSLKKPRSEPYNSGTRPKACLWR